MDVVAAIRSAWVQRVGADLSEHWFDSGLTLDLVEDVLTVRLPNAFLRDRFRRIMHADLLEAVRHAAPSAISLTYETSADARQAPIAGEQDDANQGTATAALAFTVLPPPDAESSQEQPNAAPLDSQTSGGACGNGEDQQRSVRRRRAKLSQIISGESNRMALTAVEMTLKDLGRWSPLVLYGPPGSGKTMILEGVLQRVRQANNGRAVMLSSEQFTVDFLEALGGSGLPSFRRRYRDLQVLILDDVQFLIGKNATRRELLHTLESLHRQGSQLVISADRPPAELHELGPELVARFSSGMVGAVDHPDREMRLRILSRLAPPELLDQATLGLLAERIHGDARLLQGAVNRLQALASVLQRSPTAQEAEHSLQDFFRSTQRRIGLKEIVQATSMVLGVDASGIESNQRHPSVAHPRMLAMFLARKHTQAPLKEISGYFRKRSHSTVVSACGEVSRWLQEDRQMQLLGGGALPIADIIRRIEAKLNRA